MMRPLLVAALLLGCPSWGEPGLRVDRVGSELRLRGDGPLQVRTRQVGPRLRADVSPVPFLVAPLPPGMVASRPGPGTVRLEWPAPPRSVARCVQATDGSVRVLEGRAAQCRPAPGKLVTLDFEGADLVNVLRALANSMGRRIYIGPEAEGQVTLNVRSAPAEATLSLILAEQLVDLDYKSVDDGQGGTTLVVASGDKLATIPNDIFKRFCGYGPPLRSQADGQRVEILLERAEAAQVVEVLSSRFPDVQLTLHPTKNGFYVFGSRLDIVTIQAQIPDLDRPPQPQLPASELITVRYLDVQEARAILTTLYSDLAIDVTGQALRLLGKPQEVLQAAKLLAEFDRPADRVELDLKFLPLSDDDRDLLGLSEDESDIQVLPDTVELVKPQISLRVRSDGERPGTGHLGDKVSLPYFDPFEGAYLSKTVDLGLTVSVVPRLQADGMLDLCLYTEISYPEALVSNQYALMVRKSREVSVRVKGGETVLVRNLVPPELTAIVGRHPLFGDLPGIGAILRSSTVAPLVLVITPRLLR